MESRHHLFVFGSGGMLGHYVVKYFSQFPEKYVVHSFNRSQFNVLTDMPSLAELFEKHTAQHPDALSTTVINAIGVIPQTGKDENALYITVNSVFPHVLAAECQRAKFRLVHPTTDCVYDGVKGKYNEKDVHTETNIYGSSKSAGEPSAFECACILRCSIIGEEVHHHRSLLEWIKSQKNNTIKGFKNHAWNGITCLQWAKVVQHCIEHNGFWSGVRHIVGETVSKYDIAVMMNDIYDLNLTIEPFDTPKSCDKTLSSIHDPVVSIPPLADQIKQLKSFPLYFYISFLFKPTHHASSGLVAPSP